MKNATQADPDLRKLGELIDGIDVAMLTTRAADGTLVSRPLQTLQFDPDGELVFFTSTDSHKVEELAACADVNLAYAHPGAQRYVSVRGHATIDRDPQTIDALWSARQAIFFPQGKHDPDLVVLRVHVRDAAYWESAGNFIARALDFAKGMLSDDPRDLGRHGMLGGGS